MGKQSAKMTPALRRAAIFLRDNGPVGAVPVAIGLRNITRLVGFGWAEECGKEPGAWGFVKHRLTESGRAALTQHKDGE